MPWDMLARTQNLATPAKPASTIRSTSLLGSSRDIALLPRGVPINLVGTTSGITRIPHADPALSTFRTTQQPLFTITRRTSQMLRHWRAILELATHVLPTGIAISGSISAIGSGHQTVQTRMLVPETFSGDRTSMATARSICMPATPLVECGSTQVTVMAAGLRVVKWLAAGRILRRW